MCSVDAPKPVEVEKPVFVRNPFLDEAAGDVKTAAALRRGRSSLVIPKNNSIGTSGRGSETTAAGIIQPNGNSQNPISGSGVGTFQNASPGTSRRGSGGGGRNNGR
jgi:hypothetical protein